MTIKELIEKLKKFEPNLEVFIYQEETRASDQGNYPIDYILMNEDGEVIITAK